MIEKFLLCSAILFVCTCLGAAEEENAYQLPSDVVVNDKVIPAGTYILRIDTDSHRTVMEIMKGDSVLGTQKAIVLPARGSGKTSISSVKAGKRDFVRIRFRESDNWYIVYLPVQPAPQPAAQTTSH